MDEKTDKMARIPRELIHEQHERLSNKHIQTLSFLQEMANENKTLRERVKHLEDKLEGYKDLDDITNNRKEEMQKVKESFLARAEDINKLAEKHQTEIRLLEEEKMELERTLKEQILKMHHEIESLKDANQDLRETAKEDEVEENKQKIKELTKQNQMMQKQNEELTEEIELLRSDLEILQSKKAKDISQLQEVFSENKLLKHSLQDSQQKINELEYKLDKALSELSEKLRNEDDFSEIEELKETVKQLLLEKEAKDSFVSQMKLDMKDLLELKNDLMLANNHLQSKLDSMFIEYGHLLLELEQLKKYCNEVQDKKTFKDFVLLKRELNSLKDENETLKLRSKATALSHLREPEAPAPVLKPQKKHSLDGTRSGAKKLMAITLGSSAS
ncbi:putative leucine-rich repeat-containing protein DDB_G0290503 [Physella acuta]|uniref:putative leucine-rich repeat-containing protein DDB_G0290503 n=1 Tax=Physella acuta TaxID=109671 RepID=UPI0027DAE2B6|nr:putative leucine-rich repeat-containing protein DDB_G0290503 [Physella acuta]